jgi:hypothetical protein
MRRLALPCIAAVALGGCVEFLDPGEFGEPRYFGEIRGAAPLQVLAPTSDREGNVYVLYGASDLNIVEAFVGHKNGGWSSGCDLHKGDDRGAHGWIGRDLNRAWYWSGDSLVEVNGRNGSCQPVLDRDPASNANLLFQGTAPLVKETPSRTFTIAMIQSATDRLPFLAVVDLDLKRYTSVSLFEPTDAANVVVLGAGARDDRGFFLVRYERGGAQIVEGLFVNLDGEIVGRGVVEGAPADLPEDAIAGFLQSRDGNVVVGLIRGTDQIIAFDDNTGSVRSVAGVAPAGIHHWEGKLFVVGTAGVDPAIAELDGLGNPVQPVVWNSAVNLSAALNGAVRVLDDRSDPRRGVTWTNPVSAIGSHPFVSEHNPDVYALDTTGWLIAGPSFDVGGLPQTSVAFIPAGLSYP